MHGVCVCVQMCVGVVDSRVYMSVHGYVQMCVNVVDSHVHMYVRM